MAIQAHARQFFLLKSDNSTSPAFPDWRTLPLPAGWTLHVHPGAAVEILDAAPEAPVIRIGHGFNLDAGGETGGGRFALLKWPEILTDAGGLQALYHGARPGRQAVGSSAAVAARALDGAPRPLEGAPPLAHPGPFNYIPAPGAAFAGLRKLFHDQKIDLRDFRVLHRPSPIRRLASHDAALAMLAGELLRFAENLRARTPGKVYLPLTAGLDSRTIAAAFLAAGLPFETVTLDYRGKPHSDVTVARAISRRFGLRHRTFPLAAAEPAAVARFAAHTAGAFRDWDHDHIYPGGGYGYLAAGDAMVVGACFEIGRQLTGETRFKGLDFASATGAEVWARRAGTAAPGVHEGFLDEWIAWRRAHPLEMDFAAAFYLDQRIGAWRSALEQGYDLLPGVSICPANAPLIYSALITPSPADQRAGRLQREVIGLLAPELLDFPFNPRSLRHRARDLRRQAYDAVAAQLAGVLPGRGLDPLRGD